MTIKPLRNVFVALAVLALSACNGNETKVASESTAVPRFHALYDAGDFSTIYAEAHEKFREATSRADYDKFIGAVRRKLGRVKSTERQNWNVNVGTGGTRVVLTYLTKFEHGEGTESFTFLSDEGKPKLLGWHINSTALIVN